MRFLKDVPSAYSSPFLAKQNSLRKNCEAPRWLPLRTAVLQPPIAPSEMSIARATLASVMSPSHPPLEAMDTATWRSCSYTRKWLYLCGVVSAAVDKAQKILKNDALKRTSFASTAHSSSSTADCSKRNVARTGDVRKCRRRKISDERMASANASAPATTEASARNCNSSRQVFGLYKQKPVLFCESEVSQFFLFDRNRRRPRSQAPASQNLRRKMLVHQLQEANAKKRIYYSTVTNAFDLYT